MKQAEIEKNKETVNEAFESSKNVEEYCYVVYQETKDGQKIRLGLTNFEPVQVDQTGKSIGEKIASFIVNNQINAPEEYDEQYDLQEGEWDDEEPEIDPTNDISFDKVDAQDLQRELSDRMTKNVSDSPVEQTIITPGEKDNTKKVENSTENSKQSAKETYPQANE